jgi:hypothetical protein
MKYTDAYYPTVLRDNEQVYFRLRCRKFIEMIRREAELNMLLEERRSRKPRRQQGDEDNDDEVMIDDEEEDDIDDLDMAADDLLGGSGGADVAGLSKLSQEVLAYGMELRAEFKADPRRETSKRLDEIFSLIAYPNPLMVKEVAHLLDGSGRVAVAEELNSAILSMFTPNPPTPFLSHGL